MEDKSVPYIVYESAQARSERRDKRLIIVLIIVTAMLFVSNLVWLWSWLQYDYVSEEITYTQDGQGMNNINTGTQGDLSYEPATDR